MRLILASRLEVDAERWRRFGEIPFLELERDFHGLVNALQAISEEFGVQLSTHGNYLKAART